MRTSFANMGRLADFIWRRDRLRIPIWLISIIGTSVAVALAFPAIYPPGPERDILAQTLRNPALISMIGPGYGLDDYHMGAVMAHQMLLFTAIAVCIMNVLLAVRHTRGDEERGRIEVIRSLPVGRLSNAGATLLVLTLSNLAMAAFLAVALSVLGLEGMDWRGSILYGTALGTIGIFFAAATVFIAQLTETSRGALGFSFSLLGLSYLLRAVGDVGNEPLSLVSPLGLLLRTRVYVHNNWWPIGVIVAVSVFFAYLAFRLNLIRDLGAGFIAAKPGRKTASRYLRGPFTLGLRLQKVTIISWTVGMFVLGISYGSVFGDLDAFFRTSDIFELLLPGIEGFSVTDQFTATLLAVISMIGAVPALIVTLKIRAEEQQNRTEHLLARAVSRWSLLGSYLVIGVFIAVTVQFAACLGLWLATSAVMAEPYEFSWILKGGLAYLPAQLITIGLAALSIGFAPKLASIVWLYLGYTFFVVYFGGLLRLPDWMTKLTPFGYIPDVPLEQMGVLLTFSLLLVAAILAFLGLVGYGRRDVYG